MFFIDRFKRRHGLGAVALLAGCASTALPPDLPSPSRTTATRPAQSPPGAASVEPPAQARLAPPAAVRSWAELRAQAALRMVAANPGGTYTGTVPDVLLAIPVLEIELHGDGSVRRITVIRAPGQAADTVALAIAAVHRAAPFGNVSHLPRPWIFAETFLFDDARRFKPRTLDL